MTELCTIASYFGKSSEATQSLLRLSRRLSAHPEGGRRTDAGGSPWRPGDWEESWHKLGEVFMLVSCSF